MLLFGGGGGELLLLRFAFEAQNFDRLSALPLPCPALPCPALPSGGYRYSLKQTISVKENITTTTLALFWVSWGTDYSGILLMAAQGRRGNDKSDDSLSK